MAIKAGVQEASRIRVNEITREGLSVDRDGDGSSAQTELPFPARKAILLLFGAKKTSLPNCDSD